MSRRIQAAIVLALSFFLSTAKDARPFGLFDGSAYRWPAKNIRNMDQVTVVGVGSVFSYQGHVNTVRISYQDAGVPMNPQCRAVILTNDQKTLDVSVDLPSDIRPQDPPANLFHFYREALCDQLQTAEAEGWKVALTVRVKSMDASGPSAYSLTRLETGPEISNDAAAPAMEPYSCPSGNCSPEGAVTSIATDINSRAVLCQAALKLTPANGAPQSAEAVVRLDTKISDYGSMDPSVYGAFMAKRSICAGLLGAMAYGQTVTVTGRIGGSSIVANYLER